MIKYGVEALKIETAHRPLTRRTDRSLKQLRDFSFPEESRTLKQQISFFLKSSQAVPVVFAVLTCALVAPANSTHLCLSCQHRCNFLSFAAAADRHERTQEKRESCVTGGRVLTPPDVCRDAAWRQQLLLSSVSLKGGTGGLMGCKRLKQSFECFLFYCSVVLPDVLLLSREGHWCWLATSL